MLFHQCEAYWWSSILFIGNFYPPAALNNEGCMFWAFHAFIDLQLFTFIPFVVLAWLKWPKLTMSAIVTIAIASTILIFTLVMQSGLTAGLMSLENTYVVRILFNKPYFHL